MRDMRLRSGLQSRLTFFTLLMWLGWALCVVSTPTWAKDKTQSSKGKRKTAGNTIEKVVTPAPSLDGQANQEHEKWDGGSDRRDRTLNDKGQVTSETPLQSAHTGQGVPALNAGSPGDSERLALQDELRARKAAEEKTPPAKLGFCGNINEELLRKTFADPVFDIPTLQYLIELLLDKETGEVCKKREQECDFEGKNEVADEHNCNEQNKTLRSNRKKLDMAGLCKGTPERAANLIRCEVERRGREAAAPQSGQGAKSSKGSK